MQGHGIIENHITDTQTEALQPTESPRTLSSPARSKRRAKLHMIRHILRAAIPKPPSTLWTQENPRMSNLLQNPQNISQPHHKLKHLNPGKPVKKNSPHINRHILEEETPKTSSIHTLSFSLSLSPQILKHMTDTFWRGGVGTHRASPTRWGHSWGPRGS